MSEKLTWVVVNPYGYPNKPILVACTESDRHLWWRAENRLKARKESQRFVT